MAYSSRYRRRSSRSSYSRSSRSNRGITSRLIARRGARLTRWKDSNLTAAAIKNDASTHRILLNGLDLGTQADQRSGSSVYFEDLKINGLIKSGSTGSALTTNNIVRFIIYKDNSPGGTAMTTTNVLSLLFNSAGGDTAVFLNQRPDQSTRMSVLYDHLFSIPAATASKGSTAIPFSTIIPLNCVTTYTGSPVTDESTIARNAIGILILSLTVSGVATDNPNAAYNCRLTFRDYN